MSWLTDLLKEIPLSAVLRERMTQAEAKITALEKEDSKKNAAMQSLQLENANLRAELDNARAEIARLNQPPKHQAAWGSRPRIKGRMES